MPSPVLSLLKSFSVQELLHHPWRNLAAVVAVMLGVALGFAVHLINASALDEFSQAMRAVGGQADLELRSASADPVGLDETALGLLQHHPQVQAALPVLELGTYALPAAPSESSTQRVALRVIGVDVLQVATLNPGLLPIPQASDSPLTLLAPERVYLNAAAQRALAGSSLRLQHGLQAQAVQVAGSVRASGSPLAVMDIAAAQDFFAREGWLSRIDIRLVAGTDRHTFVQALEADPRWKAQWQLRPPGDAAERVDQLSRAYRVNLSVLALIALFTGGFLVFSVVALSVARRTQQFGLLGVLGLTGAERQQLVLGEAAALGLLGSGLGVALGTGLAALALQLLGGDLGGGYFAGTSPALQWSPVAALGFAAMGMATALAGAWWPARQAQALPPALSLKGLGSLHTRRLAPWIGPALLLAGAGLALLPPVRGMPLGAYLGVALLLLGGVVSMPWLIRLLLDRLAPTVARAALPMLALERARRVRESAAVAVSGVVAALSLAVALTVMVGSFRQSVTAWLDTVLPAALYVRSGVGSANEQAYFDPGFVQAAERLPGVERMTAQRTLTLQLEPTRPPVALLARPLRDPVQGGLGLPLVGEALPVPSGQVGIYVSEAMVDLYGARLGGPLEALQRVWDHPAGAEVPRFFVAGIWRDYARQFGTIAMEQADFVRLRQDTRSNDLAFWLHPDADLPALETALRALADRLAGTPGGESGRLLEFGSAQQIRQTTLRIFDRSFAVTYWLQAVAVAIGLFGVAASFSAQVLARRKEFGLLAHIGLTRRQVLAVVAGEGAVWTSLGAVAGLALGLAVAVVLVKVVNPQSFHWSMELFVPAGRLAALAAAVVVCGTVTAWLAGRAAAGQDAVLAVKEDW